MMQQPDKFFREKLEQYQRPAPASAWDKIDANLNKKNSKGLWLKIAASLLLFALAGYWIWPVPQVSQVAIQKNNADHHVIKTPIKKESIHTDEVVITPMPVAKTHIKRNLRRNTPIIKNESIENHSEDITSQMPLENQPEEELLITQDVIHYEDSVVSNDISNNSTELVSVENSTTLIYTADDVNKYLTKKVEPQATTESQKQSTFKKLLNKAYDLKTNQDALGGLRQRKNEILALNFKKEKRGQNK